VSGVRGFCPMGCGSTLILGSGGGVTCGYLDCPRPEAPSELLAIAETEHVVHFYETNFAILHPLRERLDIVDYEGLEDCPLHQYLHDLDGPPIQPGRYRVIDEGAHWAYVRWPA